MSHAPPVPVPGRVPGYLGPEPFVVELERFRGPLDLLLHLIRSQDIDIFDIPIARITSQFQAALDAGLEKLQLDRAGEFIEMASTLVRIKAQLLLPRNAEPDWDEDPRADLVRRLLEYEYFLEVAHVLSAAEADRSRHFAKGYVEPRESPAGLMPELETTREEFLAAALSMPEPLPEVMHRAPVRMVTVEEKMSLLGRLLATAGRLAFDRLVRPWGTRPHAVAALMACLEMARQQLVRIEQAVPFGSIWIFPRPRLVEGADQDEEVDGEMGAGGRSAAGAGEGA
jgi:segregation and condensation protein A